ncbi:MAG: RNA polymerase sigma-70 factor [Bacteroidota bacterium]
MSALQSASLSESQLQTLFYDNYADLCRYALTFLGSTQEAEDIVQQIFLKFWEDYQQKALPINPRAYLFKTVYSRSLNALKHLNVQRKHAKYHIHQYWGTQSESSPESHVQTKELESALSKALGEMSETTRQTFILSRFHGLSHKEIAETLSFSLKNVEYHLHKAMQILKIKLSTHALLWLAFLIISTP